MSRECLNWIVNSTKKVLKKVKKLWIVIISSLKVIIKY